jgi:hypothetical protein
VDKLCELPLDPSFRSSSTQTLTQEDGFIGGCLKKFGVTNFQNRECKPKMA